MHTCIHLCTPISIYLYIHTYIHTPYIHIYPYTSTHTPILAFLAPNNEHGTLTELEPFLCFCLLLLQPSSSSTLVQRRSSEDGLENDALSSNFIMEMLLWQYQRRCAVD